MPLDLSTILTSAPAIVGMVGGVIGIISGIAVFARRRLRLIVTVTQNNDAHDAWHTVNIANRSDLAVDYRDAAIGWFIMTPLGRLFLCWAFCPEDETDVQTLPPHGTATIRINQEGWDLAYPPERRDLAYLRMYLHLPARGRSVWLPVRLTKWSDYSLRERILRRLYIKRDTSGIDLPM